MLLRFKLFGMNLSIFFAFYTLLLKVEEVVAKSAAFNLRPVFVLLFYLINQPDGGLCAVILLARVECCLLVIV